MENKILDFKEIYKFPFRITGVTGIYVHSSNNVKTFTILNSDKEFVEKVIKILNDEIPNDIEKEVIYDTTTGRIIIDNKPIFLLRGWGHLTGIGGLNIPIDKALKIQEDFGNWIVEKLSNKNNWLYNN